MRVAAELLLILILQKTKNESGTPLPTIVPLRVTGLTASQCGQRLPAL